MLSRIAWSICFLLVGITCAAAEDNTAANKIFVETVQLLDQAAAAKPSEAIGLYEKALKNLDRIVNTYPGSELAVKIISGQAIGQVSRADIEKALGKARQAECLGILSASCYSISWAAITAEALITTRSIESDSMRAGILLEIVVAQTQAGKTNEALTTARSIEDASSRARALREIAAAQAQAGKTNEANATFADALTTARSIENALSRASALSGITKSLVKKGLKK